MKIKNHFTFINLFFILLAIFPNIFGYKRHSIQKEKVKNRFYKDIDINIDKIDYDYELIVNRHNTYYISFNITTNVLLTVLGNSLTNFDLDVFDFNDEEYGKMIDLQIGKYFFNGYAAIINPDILNKYNDFKLKLQLNQFDSELIYIKTRVINNGTSVTENSHIDILLERDIIEEECFSIVYSSISNAKYALNFLTYTKNIKATLKNSYDSSIFKELEINKESMTEIIEEEEYNYICFSLNGNDEQKAGLSFELLNLDLTTDKDDFNPNNIVIYNQFTLIRGLFSEQYLPKGNALAYKTDDYKFKDIISFMFINFHILQGKPKLYIIKCKEYPDCILTKNEIKEYKEYDDINGYINIKKEIQFEKFDSKKGKDYIALVYCPDEDRKNNMDCKYEISMKNEGELTYLYRNRISYSFVNSYPGENRIDNYKINIENDYKDRNMFLYINFNKFSGNANVQFFDSNNERIEEYQTRYMGNEIIYIFNNVFIEENLELYVKIIGENNSYYSLKYNLKDKNINKYYLDEGILQFGKTNNNLENNYIIKSNYNKKSDYPIIVNINTYGNNIEISDNSEKAIINKYPNLIQLIFNDKLNEYSFSLISNEKHNENEDNKYLYSIISCFSNSKILINNGQLYMNQLNENNIEVIYVYNFYKTNENNKVMINFRKYSKNPVRISINTKSNGFKKYIINRLSKIILLNNIEINNTCNYLDGEDGKNICKIIIKIENENEITKEHIDFSIQLTGNDEQFYPIFLPQNVFVSNILIPNFNQIYYVDVPNNGRGNIYIDFMEGGGCAQAVLKKKINKYKKIIYFDYTNKYFEITSDLTKICGEDECKIYINLTTTNYMFKYNIYSKILSIDEYPKPFNIPEYEYIYGNLQEHEIHNYMTKISKQANKIIFNVNCNNCRVNINYNNYKTTFDTDVQKEFILENSLVGIHFGNFYDSVINYSIEIKNVELTKEQNYNLRIISQKLALPLIIPITSIRNEYCEINKNSPCYFIIPIEKYNKVEKIRINIPDNEFVNIYHKTIQYEKYDKYTDEELSEKIKDNYNDNNKYKIQKNYYENKISRNEVDFEIIYIIKIELDYSSEITFISSHYDIEDSTRFNLQLNDYSLMNLNHNKNNISLFNYNKNFSGIEINLIKGRGKINILEKQYILDYKIQDSINILLDSELDNIKEIIAEKDDDKDQEEFIINIKSLKYNYSNNLVELKFQKNNYFNYLGINKKEPIKSLNFYMKLNITSDEIKLNDDIELKNINLNYKFTNNNKISRLSKDNNEEIFDITIYLVNQLFINHRKINPDEEPFLNELDIISNYRMDIKTGYALINAHDLHELLIGDTDYYLYIIISPFKNNNMENINDINIMLSAFDLTNNYYLPVNEYLTLSINQNTKLNLGKKLELYNNSIIEFVLDDKAFDFTILSENYNYYYINSTLINTENKDLEYYGKTFINKKFLSIEKSNILFLFLNKEYTENENDYQNVLIKYRLSDSNIINYFSLKDGNVKYNEIEDTISIKLIMENNLKEVITDETVIIYNIRIFDYTNNIDTFSNNILFHEKPYKIIKYINPDIDTLTELKIDKIPNGFFYISVLAEARKGNIYEYFIYNPVPVKKISNETIVNITINKNSNYHIGNLSKSFIYRAKVEKNNGGYIKLSIKHKNYYNENNYIYASNNHEFISSENLYKDSEYKTIDRNTSLIIPVNQVRNSFLFIRIPCTEICDYTFNYIIYEKDIIINDDECFDFKISDNQNFIYNINNFNKKLSLLTMTSYSLNHFTISFIPGNPKLKMDNTYFNGYSHIINPFESPETSQSLEPFHNNKFSFKIEGNSIFQICHRTLAKNYIIYNNKYDTKDIFIGDKIYTRIENNNQECFNIYKKEDEENLSNYIITFITKTKNIFVDFYNSENDVVHNLTINEESDNIILDSDINKFCISKINKNRKQDEREREHGNNANNAGLLIHLLSMNNKNIINQNLNMPLTKGLSTRQILKKGQFLYYRINENTINSNLINVHIQNVIGCTKVYYSSCNDFPYCSFSYENIDNKTEQKNINNNIYFNIEIKKGEEDIYHKSQFPVVIVYCSNEDSIEDECNYYIEMSNDNDILLLNENRKIYDLIQSDSDEHQYKFSLVRSNYNENDIKKLFIQIYSLTGKANFIVNDIKPTRDNQNIENYFEYNNNTIFFIQNLDNNKNEFKIKVKGEKKTYYNIFYYLINERNETERNIYLSSREVHYSILNKHNLDYFYSFQDKKGKVIDDRYLVSINPINCDLYASKEYEKYDQKRNQFIINSNEKIKIYYNSTINDICEFTISATEMLNSKNLKNFKELIINDGIYQIYHYPNNIKYNSTTLNYFISRNDIINKRILININKMTEANLVLEYSINNKSIKKNITDYNEIIEINLKDINLENNIFDELYNFNILKIVITVAKMGPPVDIDFKIKINEKNLPSYLNSENIEYGLVSKGQYVYYYFDYQKNEKFQIYLDCRGTASFKIINVDKNKKYKKEDNYRYYNNKCNLPIDNVDEEPNKNYIDIDSCFYNICQAYIIIFIPDDYKNEKTLFNIYKHSEKNILNVPLNQYIYGALSNNMPHRYYSETDLKKPIKIVLNCRNCKMCYYIEEPRDEREKGIKCSNPFDPSKDKYLLIQNNRENKINYIIFTDNNDNKENPYYSIYLFKDKSPKYINQNVPEFCQTPCILILQISRFYYYNQNNIVLYTPDDEQTVIEETIIRKEEYSNLQDLQYFIINDNYETSESSFISNKLIINITEKNELFKNDLFIQIRINSKNKRENKNITFITSQFYNSLNSEIMPCSQTIFTINNNNNSKINDFLNNLNIKNESYKMEISLIEGSGLFILNKNNEELNYLLSYETQERISFILKNNDVHFRSEKNLENKNLIFYVKIDKKENQMDEEALIFGKTNYLNYFKDDKNSNIFPIKQRININKSNNDLHINFRFSKLINSNNNNERLMNVTNENFDIKINAINKIRPENKKELNAYVKYYCELRRGYIYLEKSLLSNSDDYLEIIIDKNKMNDNNYERVSLDITPFNLDNTIEFPRNNYLEVKINNRRQDIKLKKPMKEYKNVYIELSSNEMLNFSIRAINYDKKEKIYGKNYYSIINDDEQAEYTVNLNSKNSADSIGTILLKYFTNKNNKTQFALEKSDINIEKIDNSNYNYKINYSNLKNGDKSNIKYKLNYLIRLYDCFSFDNGKKPNNIFTEEWPIMSFRKELTEEELKNDVIEYNINFGQLNRGKYYISILGEVLNNSIVEYFAYDSAEFSTKNVINSFRFDYTWLIIIFILLFSLIITTYFLVRVCIKYKNNKDQEGLDSNNTRKMNLINENKT